MANPLDWRLLSPRWKGSSSSSPPAVPFTTAAGSPSASSDLADAKLPADPPPEPERAWDFD